MNVTRIRTAPTTRNATPPAVTSTMAGVAEFARRAEATTRILTVLVTTSSVPTNRTALVSAGAMSAA